jgi:hypothetical protein
VNNYPELIKPSTIDEKKMENEKGQGQKDTSIAINTES